MKTGRTILSLLLCGAMLFSLCARPVFAEADVQAQEPVNNSETGSEDDPGCSGQTVEAGAEAEPESPENTETNPVTSENTETPEDTETNPETSENSQPPEDTEANPETSKNTETTTGTETSPETSENSETTAEAETNPETSENPKTTVDTETNPETSENPETTVDAETRPEISKNPETVPEMPEAADSASGNAAASANAEKQETETTENTKTTMDTENNPEASENTNTPEQGETELPKDTKPSEEPAAPLPARMGTRRAAARASGINMIYANFVFAQGVPIVIRQNGSITSVYSGDGDLLSGNTDVSGYAIYGGWYDGNNEHTATTSVTMESGSISQLFGGSFSGTLTGSTSVVVKGGEITNIVCGGGNQSVINGSTRVEINGGMIGIDGNENTGYVYGGGFSSKVTESTTLIINSGAKIYQTVYGGSNHAPVKSTRVILNGGDVGWVYGGGYAGEVTGVTSVEINGGAVNMHVYGGGNGFSGNSTVYGGTGVKVNGGMVGSVFGGGYYGTVAGDTSVAIGGTAQITGTVYGGGNNAAVDNSHVEINGGTVTSVYGGGEQGAVTKSAVVTVTGGTIKDSVYGGGNEAAAKNTGLVITGGTVTNQIYGGGFGSGSSVETACVELKGGACGEVYGGGRNPGSTVKQTTVTLGADWGYTKQVFAGGSFDAVTDASQVIIQNYATQSGQNDFLSIDAKTAGDSQVVIRRNEGGPSGSANTSAFNLTPTGVKKIAVEYGEVTLLGQKGLELRLDSLDIRANGQVRFQDWDTVEIRELSGSGGQLLFPAQFVSGTATIVNRPVTVGKISAAAPLIIKAEGAGWGTNLKDFYFFEGAGVDALTSAGCFFSEGYEVVLREIPGKNGAKGVYLQKKEAEKPVYISKLELNQNSVAYNGTISLTVGVGVQLATADKLELIPDARIQIRGSNDRNVLFADIQVSKDGKSAAVTGVDGVTSPARVDGTYITIALPVNADLLDTCQEGLTMIATAPNQYSSTARLVGPNNETGIDITPTPVTLTKTIPDPDSRDSVEGELEDGAFYTAGFRWHVEDDSAVGAFVPDRNYQADIILAPREGHWLSAASIGNTVTYDGKAVSCVFNADGTATLKNVKSMRFAGYWTVAASAFPAEGGSVTGSGSYASGSQVTVKAQPAGGWHFVKWTEGGAELSGNADYTFTVTGNRTLVAVFERNDDPTPPQPATYTVTVQNDGNGTAFASPTSAAAGTTINLTAAANSGYHFKKWQVVSGGVTVNDSSFVMPAANVIVKAVFEQDSTPQPARYSVTVNGSYAEASGAGSYEAGATVSVHAGSRSNYRFDGWTSSDGIDFANARNASTTFTMPNQSVTVTANWTYTGGSSGGSSGGGSGGNSGSSSGGGSGGSSGDSSGGDSSHTPSYDGENLADGGVTLSGGRIHEHARLTVTKNRLHNSGDCGYCDQIRQWREQGRVIAIYDVSLSYGFQGTVTLTFPVSGEYDGKTLTVVHCLKDRLDTCDATVSNGKVTITVDSLSPFAILDNSKDGNGTNRIKVKSPQTGDSGVSAWTVSGVCALPAALILRAAVIFKRRRRTKAGTSV